MKTKLLLAFLALALGSGAGAADRMVSAADSVAPLAKVAPAYLKRMLDTVQIQWERVILQESASPAVGTTVTVRFTIDAEGKVTNVVPEKSKAGAAGVRACVRAITDRSPYGPWSDEMKKQLGAKQELAMTFCYQ